MSPTPALSCPYSPSIKSLPNASMSEIEMFRQPTFCDASNRLRYARLLRDQFGAHRRDRMFWFRFRKSYRTRTEMSLGFSGERTRGSVSPGGGESPPACSGAFRHALAKRLTASARSARSCSARSRSARPASKRSISFSLMRSSSSPVRWLCSFCLRLVFGRLPIQLLFTKRISTAPEVDVGRPRVSRGGSQ